MINRATTAIRQWQNLETKITHIVITPAAEQLKAQKFWKMKEWEAVEPNTYSIDKKVKHWVWVAKMQLLGYKKQKYKKIKQKKV